VLKQFDTSKSEKEHTHVDVLNAASTHLCAPPPAHTFMNVSQSVKPPEAPVLTAGLCGCTTAEGAQTLAKNHSCTHN